MSKIATITFQIFIALFFLACSSKKVVQQQGPTDPTSIEAKQIAAQKEAAAVTEIQFSKGSTQLSAQSQKQLREILRKTTDPKGVDDIKIITWADHEYPSVHTKKLSKDQTDLAKKRLNTIADFVNKDGENYKVEKINMAEQPNALEKFFNTEDARIKKTLESLGIPNTYTAVKTHGKASKAIVMVVLKR